MMKNLFFALCFSPLLMQGQETCSGIENRSIFQANQIGATIYPHGYKFFDPDGFFKVPYTSKSSASTIFASNAWVGAYREGQLKIAAQGFASDSEFDFHVGPLLNGSTPLDSSCTQFNRVWSVTRSDIESHIVDFESDGFIDDTLATIFQWPAEGNIYFKEFNGFSLPASHQGGWADFLDKNLNGLYEPQLGEYPCILLNGQTYLPERMMWMVYHDQGPHTYSYGEPLGVEIQLSMYGFNCMDNPLLNQVLFNTYKVINRQDQPLDSLYFGMWTDYDLGCATDDYIGCDTLRHTEFVYNADGLDGSIGTDCTTGSPTYGDNPPVQSFTYLSHPMHSFADGRIEEITLPLKFYNTMKGLWPDGTPITIHNGGYNPGSDFPTTRFLFNGDPRDTAQWSQVSISAPLSDRRTISSVSVGQLGPYETIRIDGAYMFHQDSGMEHLQEIGFMLDRVDLLRAGYANGSLVCTAFEDCESDDCVWPGDFNHNGKADHYDLLSWGVANGQQGAPRNGIIDWDGYFADDWDFIMPGNLNAKYADGNGDGSVSPTDLERNGVHFSFVNANFEEESHFPEGPHLLMRANPIIESGTIRNLRVYAGEDIPNVLGLAFELDYDTSLLFYQRLITFSPADSNFYLLLENGYGEEGNTQNTINGFAFVKADHLPITIDSGFAFLATVSTTGFKIRPDVAPGDIPDSTIIRIKNLIAVDADGNDLQIGSEPIVIYRDEIVSNSEPVRPVTKVFPNPADGFLQILTDIDTEGQLFSIQGHLIRQFNKSELQGPVDVSVLFPGVYILQITETGESVKVVIQ